MEGYNLNGVCKLMHAVTMHAVLTPPPVPKRLRSGFVGSVKMYKMKLKMRAMTLEAYAKSEGLVHFCDVYEMDIERVRETILAEAKKHREMALNSDAILKELYAVHAPEQTDASSNKKA